MINNILNSYGFSRNLYKDSLDFEICRICNEEYDFFLDKSNVIGVGFGNKRIGGFLTTIKSIVVFVTKKIPKCFLDINSLIPSFYNGIPTDVLEFGICNNNFKIFNNKVRPTVGGCSISLANNTVGGTLGCLVKNFNGIYILSNNHIIANNNMAHIGDPVIQPSLSDHGIFPNDVVAHLTRFIPLQHITPTTRPNNLVDCAIAKVTNPSIASSKIGIINLPPRGIVDPILNYPVKKVGCTTGLTTGSVIAINTAITINNEYYINQIISTVKVEYGDSGSILLDEDNFAMGLIMAGSSPLSSYSIANPISSVLNLLNVSLVTS